LPAARDARLDGADRYAEHLRDLLVVELVYIHQHQQRAEVGRQRVQRGRDLVVRDLLRDKHFGVAQRLVPPAAKIFQLALEVFGGRRKLLAAGAAVAVAEVVVQDGQQPGATVSPRRILVEVAIGPEQRLLGPIAFGSNLPCRSARLTRLRLSAWCGTAPHQFRDRRNEIRAANHLTLAHALLVAVPRYDDPAYPPLGKAYGAARALAEVFARGGYSHAHPELLEGGDSKSIGNTLDDWFRTAGKADVIVLYWAGHGKRDGDGYFLVTRNSPASNLTGWNSLSASDLGSAVAKSPAEKVLILLDTCYSGAGAGEIANKITMIQPFHQHPARAEPKSAERFGRTPQLEPSASAIDQNKKRGLRCHLLSVESEP
jgi:Caspase domain